MPEEAELYEHSSLMPRPCFQQLSRYFSEISRHHLSPLSTSASPYRLRAADNTRRRCQCLRSLKMPFLSARRYAARAAVEAVPLSPAFSATTRR